MRYMRMPVSGGGTVTVPHLNGGVNVYDVPNRVGDNQLTECNNLWWHRGALRTRPGLTIHNQWEPHDIYRARQRVDEREISLTRFEENAGRTVFTAAHLNLSNKNFQRWYEQGTFLETEGAPNSVLAIRARKNDDGEWYFLMSTGEIVTDVKDGEPYVPIVLINGVGEESKAEAEPSVYEDYNMLTRGFRCHYTTDGESYTWKLPEGNLATDLPGAERESEEGGLLAKIEVDVSDGSSMRTIQTLIRADVGGIWHQSYIDEDGTEQYGSPGLTAQEAGVTGEGWSSIALEAKFNATKGVLNLMAVGKKTNQAGAADPVSKSLPSVVSNNLRITVWRSREYEKDRLTICKMTRGEWFGGDTSGIAGGTRYFVCGNPDEPDLLCWSGIEHPLYFPEHNRVRVGDDHQAITAMGKQGNLLVLYKERETYALQYSAGTADDYAFAESGGVAITSYMAKFLLIPINASVGCDCPDTVRLVNNRLVWACSDGSVYMLTGVNQYSERNVRMISRNVRRLLTECGKDALKDAQAGEYEGYYLLLVGNKVFLMNTQTSAFASFNYYDDEDAASKAIPWYVWTLPDRLRYVGMVSGDNTVMLAVFDPVSGTGTVATLEGATDDGAPIPCRLTTKLWDFGIPDRKKSVGQIYMGLGCEDLSRLQVTYVTDRGRMNDPYRMQNSIMSHEGYLPRRRLTPGVHMVQAFGLCLDSPTALELDEIQMKIRQQGVVR